MIEFCASNNFIFDGISLRKSMLQGDLTPVPGFTGKRKVETEIKIQTVKENQYILSVIREDVVHMTSYPVNTRKLKRIGADDFWVLKDRDIYLELLTYRASIAEQITYDRKNDYFLLIHNYLTRSILPSEFRAQFLQMEKEDSEKAYIIFEDFQLFI